MFCRLAFGFVLLLAKASAQVPLAAPVSNAMHNLSVGADQVYHVRDLRISRGGIRLYLTDGYLAFAAPVAGKTVAAVFTTVDVEAGDAEALVVPPNRSERASLAYYAKTPNLDEHFNNAVFLFTDNTYAELMAQIRENEMRAVPEQAPALAAKWNSVLRNIAVDVEVPFIASLVNGGPPEQGMFYAVLGGLTLGPFDMTYDPHQLESSVVGKVVNFGEKGSQFEVWTSFGPQGKKEAALPEPFHIDSYRIETFIQPDLRVRAVTRLQIKVEASSVRALDFQMSQLMRVTAASVNGQTAEIFQHDSVRQADENDIGHFLVTVPDRLPVGRPLEVEIHHEGAVIQSAGDGSYFVEARNVWFPYRPLGETTFDLTFHSAPQLRVVSSGRLVSDVVRDGERVVHRVLATPARYVGFNLGDFVEDHRDESGFHVECFTNRSLLSLLLPREALPLPSLASPHTRQNHGFEPPSRPEASGPLANLASQTARVLRDYGRQWGPPVTTDVAVTPIAGSFGQGFPGLIYLSSVSYLPEDARPAALRTPLLDMFYSDMLLPHEIAHQWWGNLVMTANYRSGWLSEALANFAAWQLFEKNRGSPFAAQLLTFYSRELTKRDERNQTVDSAGPLELGIRLRLANNPETWRIIIYDKGTWVIRMLQQRLGEARFEQLLATLAHSYRDKPLSNEAFRTEAARLLPKTDPDPTLELFFDTWVYGVGIPRLSLTRNPQNAAEYSLQVNETERDFVVDVPLLVNRPGQAATVQWVRASGERTTFSVSGPRGTKVSLPKPTEFLYAL